MATRTILVEVTVKTSIEIDENILNEDAADAGISIPFQLDDESIAKRYAADLEQAFNQYEPWDLAPFRTEGYCVATLSMTPRVIEGS